MSAPGSEAAPPLVAEYRRPYDRETDGSETRRSLGGPPGTDLRGLRPTARRGPHTIGFATLHRVRVPTGAATTALLDTPHVRPDHRAGRTAGAGTAPPRAAVREADDHGLSRPTREAAPGGRAARAPYDRFPRAAADPEAPSARIHHHSYSFSTKGEQ
ncbi:GNAT family N-acetyltransferase [Streptomyces sudanensis]|uniref:GNAT family N-acetyltransferase n=1 Tax=Streptomyces sudanensis TaxID=436397 RepID=UPI0020CE78EB|nr:GNAT family N-acetyltransferase [Streptomyces sudanensis]MCP9956927.1 GNAT family N-acetyltransferase [Streptomyces sudanensis]MCQ0002488.1 GNAT family N-acetyltransferase [Streptomyces sudanensis]